MTRDARSSSAAVVRRWAGQTLATAERPQRRAALSVSPLLGLWAELARVGLQLRAHPSFADVTEKGQMGDAN